MGSCLTFRRRAAVTAVVLAAVSFAPGAANARDPEHDDAVGAAAATDVTSGEVAETGPFVVPGEPAGTLHMRLDTTALYGIGGQGYLGVLGRSTLGITAWDNGEASGSGDFGLALAYHNEPTFLAPWLAGRGIDGATHRVQLLVVAGHTFHMLEDRALSLGLHTQFGWNRWISRYTVDYPAEGVYGQATVERTHFVVGAQLTLTGRVADFVGLNLVAGGPFPTSSSYVITMFHVGAGLSFYVL